MLEEEAMRKAAGNLDKRRYAALSAEGKLKTDVRSRAQILYRD
jgi:hypothetical protein